MNRGDADHPTDATGGASREESPRLDREQERMFQAERVLSAQWRSRIMLGVGVVLIAGFGLVETLGLATSQTELAQELLWYRFFCAVPVWLLLYGATYLPGHVRRANLLYASATVIVCWSLALLTWEFALFLPRLDVSNSLVGTSLLVLLMSAVTLPMRWQTLAVAEVVMAGGVIGFFRTALPAGHQNQLGRVAATTIGLSLAVAVLGWYREAAERRSFAQREKMRALNAELARLNAELAHLNAEKNEFMAIAAHDLRAPLATVRGLTAQLCAGRHGEPETRARVHAAIHEQTGAMLAFVNDYLGAHTAESGALPVRLGRIDLAAAARAAAQRHAAAAAAKQQPLEVRGDGAEFFATADEALLAQVIDNFVSNAIKFSPPGAPVRIELQPAKAGQTGARLAVIDRGPGISADELAGLFRKFARASARPTAGESSHGLGLAVTKRLAEAMGGRVGCESERGAGATFWIELPATAAGTA